MPTAWCTAFHTDKHPYEYLAANPQARQIAHAHMLVQRDGRPICFNGLDFKARFAQETTDSTILFVDIGGAIGAQCVAFRNHYPDLAGRVILQDRPEMVEQATKVGMASSANFEIEAYDFFTPETVKGSIPVNTQHMQSTIANNFCVGAKAYYLRNIFHAWTDAQCIEILLNIKTGMTSESVILIDEQILAEQHVAPRGAQHDIDTLICVGM